MQKPKDGSWLWDRLMQARQPYTEALQLMTNVDSVYKGDILRKPESEDSPIELGRPAEAYARLNKVVQLIAVEAKKRYDVALHANTAAERDKTDMLEAFCRSWERQHRLKIGKDVFADAVHMAALRGRSGMHTLYLPGGNSPQIMTRVLDAMNYFPVRGVEGMEWFVTDTWVSAPQLRSFGEGLAESKTDAKRKLMNKVDFNPDNIDDVDPSVKYRVVEYWDKDWFCWGVDGELIDATEHGMGRLTMRELTFGGNALDDPRWNAMPFLGMVVDAFVTRSRLQAKLATGVDHQMFPRMLYKTMEGGMGFNDTLSGPTEVEWENVSADFEPVIIQPSVDTNMFTMLNQMIANDIDKNTLPESTFVTDIPNISGFSVQQWLGQITSQIAHFQDNCEQTFGQVMSDMMYLHEEYDQGDGWEYPMEAQDGHRQMVKRVTASDIAGHYDVSVSIRPGLPSDKIQKVTAAKQLLERDKMSGMYIIPPMAAFHLAGVDDDIEDMAALEKERDWDYLMVNDPQTKQRHIEYLRARYEGEMSEWDKFAAATKEKMSAREDKQKMKEIAAGTTADAVIQAADASPEYLRQVAALVEQGQELQAAVEIAKQTGQQQAGQPNPNGGDQQANSQLDMIMNSLYSDQAPPAKQPDGFTGYGGMPSNALPPASQGALPRQSADQAQLAVDTMNQDVQRGGLPPSKA